MNNLITFFKSKLSSTVNYKLYIYGAIGVIVLLVAVFFTGRWTAPTKYIKEETSHLQDIKKTQDYEAKIAELSKQLEESKNITVDDYELDKPDGTKEIHHHKTVNTDKKSSEVAKTEAISNKIDLNVHTLDTTSKITEENSRGISFIGLGGQYNSQQPTSPTIDLTGGASIIGPFGVGGDVGISPSNPRNWHVGASFILFLK